MTMRAFFILVLTGLWFVTVSATSAVAQSQTADDAYRLGSGDEVRVTVELDPEDTSVTSLPSDFSHCTSCASA